MNDRQTCWCVATILLGLAAGILLWRWDEPEKINAARQSASIDPTCETPCPETLRVLQGAAAEHLRMLRGSRNILRNAVSEAAWIAECHERHEQAMTMILDAIETMILDDCICDIQRQTQLALHDGD